MHACANTYKSMQILKCATKTKKGGYRAPTKKRTYKRKLHTYIHTYIHKCTHINIYMHTYTHKYIQTYKNKKALKVGMGVGGKKTNELYVPRGAAHCED